MTSAPVSASVKSYFTETPQANASNNKDVDNSFSDVLKNQKSETNKAEPERDVTSPTRVDGRTDRISDKPASIKEKGDVEVTPEEAIEQAEKVAEEVAAEMVTQAAEVLGISEEEVISLLEGLGMETEDLLTTEGLQALVLAAAGERDASSFMTDENLFSNFQSLQKTLEQAVAEVAEATGLEEADVKDIFAKLAEEVKTPAEAASVAEVTEESTEAGEDTEVFETQEDVSGKAESENVNVKEGTIEGAEIMLERSMAGNDGGNQTANQFTQENNPFAQAQTTIQNMAETVQNVQEVSSYMDADTEMIMRQITDYMRGNVTDGVSELEMQLHPESLGNLHVKLVAKDGMVTAQFLTENEAVKSVLENQMVQLKDTFKEQGVTVENIEVEVQTNGFEHSLGQQGGQQTGSDERQPERARIRRINLNDLEIAELELTEEEQLAAEMMKENGNTVDYTA